MQKISKARSIKIMVTAPPEMMADIAQVMQEYGINQSAAVRLILSNGLGRLDALKAIPKELFAQMYSTALVCFARTYGWLQAEVELAEFDGNRMKAIPDRLGVILGVKKAPDEEKVIEPSGVTKAMQAMKNGT